MTGAGEPVAGKPLRLAKDQQIAPRARIDQPALGEMLRPELRGDPQEFQRDVPVAGEIGRHAFANSPRQASGSVPTWSMRLASEAASRAASAGDAGTINSSSGSSATCRASAPDHASTSRVSTSCRSIAGDGGREFADHRARAGAASSSSRSPSVRILGQKQRAAEMAQEALADRARGAAGRQVDRGVGERERGAGVEILRSAGRQAAPRRACRGSGRSAEW